MTEEDRVLDLAVRLARAAGRIQRDRYETGFEVRAKTTPINLVTEVDHACEKLVVDGKFREDLFYRLSVFPIDVPPLRSRSEDVLQLALHFLEQTCNDFGRKAFKMTRSQVEALQAYDWPGNIRELKNVIERAVILSKGNALRLDLSLPAGTGSTAGTSKSALPGPDHVLTEKQMRALQQQNLMAALKQSGWRVSGKNGAAELLGIKPTTLADRIKSFGIRKPQR